VNLLRKSLHKKLSCPCPHYGDTEGEFNISNVYLPAQQYLIVVTIMFTFNNIIFIFVQTSNH